MFHLASSGVVTFVKARRHSAKINNFSSPLFNQRRWLPSANPKNFYFWFFSLSWHRACHFPTEQQVSSPRTSRMVFDLVIAILIDAFCRSSAFFSTLCCAPASIFPIPSICFKTDGRSRRCSIGDKELNIYYNLISLASQQVHPQFVANNGPLIRTPDGQFVLAPAVRIYFNFIPHLSATNSAAQSTTVWRILSGSSSWAAAIHSTATIWPTNSSPICGPSAATAIPTVIRLLPPTTETILQSSNRYS